MRITPEQYANDLLITMNKDEAIAFVEGVVTLYDKTRILHTVFDGENLKQVTADDYFKEVVKCIGIKTKTDI
jgi:hypothetical protein